MNRFCGIVFFVSIVLTGKSQQVEQYTQYMFNQFGINPAVAGSKECVDMLIGYRTQWVGFEGAPKTSFANIQGRIFKKKGYARGKHGIGASVVSDAIGPTAFTSVQLAYAYHLPLSARLWGSAGIFAGLQQYRFDASYVTLTNYNDNAINGSGSVLLYPDISPGIRIYNDKFYAGLSVKQIIPKNIKGWGTDQTKLATHFILTAAKTYKAKDGVSYIPSFMLKFVPMSAPDLDLNFMMDYIGKLQLGLSYRNTDGIAAIVHFTFLKYFSLGYSFDFTTSKIRLGSSNTHEITFGIFACPSSDNNSFDCPAYQ